jgi:transcriptional regulator with XRE-family HTH domain
VNTSPSSATREAQKALGLRLREIRRAAGLSGRALATLTDQHFTRVSKIENGVQAPTEADIRDWCAKCGAQGEIPDLIAEQRAVSSSYMEFRHASRAGMKRVLGAHTQEQYEATQLFRIYEHNVIPGLFQTAEYTRSMLEFWFEFLAAPSDINDAVAARMERQRVLYRPGKRISAVLEEQALRTFFGPAEVQLGQLDRLLTVMSLPSVSLGVIPLMRPRSGVPSAGFWIFDNDMAALETPSAAITVSRPSEIALYGRMFDVVHAEALHGTKARELISRVASEII